MNRSKNLGLFVGDYYMPSSNGMVLYEKLEMTWKEVVVACLKIVLFWVDQEKHKTLCRYMESLG
jgi:hypothetical protein